MKVSKEEILHIANLAQLNIEENEIEKYQENLEDILNFADIVNKAPVDDLNITVGAEFFKPFERSEIRIKDATESNEVVYLKIIRRLENEYNRFNSP